MSDEFHDLLQQRSVAMDLSAKTSDAAVLEMIQALQRFDSGLNAETVAALVLAREKEGSTAIAPGLAIPHIRLAGASGVMMSVGRSRSGIDYHARDGKPVQVFFLMIAPDDASYLRMLAKLSRTCLRRDLLPMLLETPSAASMLEILTRVCS